MQDVIHSTVASWVQHVQVQAKQSLSDASLDVSMLDAFVIAQLALSFSRRLLSHEATTKMLVITCPSQDCYFQALAGAVIALMADGAKDMQGWEPVQGMSIEKIGGGRDEVYRLHLLPTAEIRLVPIKGRTTGDRIFTAEERPKLMRQYRPLREEVSGPSHATELEKWFRQLTGKAVAWSTPMRTDAVLGNIERAFEHLGLGYLTNATSDYYQPEHPLEPLIKRYPSLDRLERSACSRFSGRLLLADKGNDLGTLETLMHDKKVSHAILVVDGFLHPRELEQWGGLRPTLFHFTPEIIAGLRKGAGDFSVRIEEVPDETIEACHAQVMERAGEFYRRYDQPILTRYWLEDALGLVHNHYNDEYEAVFTALKERWAQLITQAQADAQQSHEERIEDGPLRQAGLALIDAVKASNSKWKRAAELVESKDGLVLPTALVAPLASEIEPESRFDEKRSKVESLCFKRPQATQLSKAPLEAGSKRWFVLSPSGHGKRIGPIKVITALRTHPAGSLLLAYPFEKQTWQRFEAVRSGFAEKSMEFNLSSDLLALPAYVPEKPIQQLEVALDALAEQEPDHKHLQTMSLEERMLELLSRGGLRILTVREGAYASRDIYRNGTNQIEIVFEDGESIKRKGTYCLPRCIVGGAEMVPMANLKPGDVVDVYHTPPAFAHLAKLYWGQEELYGRICKASIAWRGGLSDFYARHYGGKNARDLLAHLVVHKAVEVSPDRLKDWMADITDAVLFPQAPESLAAMWESGVRFRTHTLEEVINCRQANISYATSLGDELCQEVYEHLVSGKMGKRLAAIPARELSTLMSKITKRATIQSIQEISDDE